MQKPFNAINGLEALELLLADVRRQLSMDGRFRQNLTYHQLSYSFRVNINTFPVDAGTFTEVVEGAVGPRQPQGFPHLAIPPAPAPGEAQTVGHTYQPQSPDPMPAPQMPVAPANELSDDEVLRLAQQRGLVPSNEASLLGRGPAPRQAVVDDGHVVEIDERNNPKTITELPRASGGSGDPITGGAREPDGRVLSIGAEHRRAFDESQELERIRQAADARAAAESAGSVEGARVIVNPNEARREAGLHVPEPTRVGGAVVDIPTPAGDQGPTF